MPKQEDITRIAYHSQHFFSVIKTINMNQETNQEERNEVKFNIACDSENRISIQVEGITQNIMAVLVNAAIKSENVKQIILATATIIKDHSEELEKIENLK